MRINYIDLTFIIGSNNRLYTKLYGKHDDFDFDIVNFPFLSSNVPSGPSYGVCISQLIRRSSKMRVVGCRSRDAGCELQDAGCRS